MKKNHIFKLISLFLFTISIVSCTPTAETDTNESGNNTNQNGAVTDKDGNSYTTVTIGTQVWFAENLKTTKDNDGTSIPLVTDGTVWKNLSNPAYCWYNNDATTNKNNFGFLYNWYTVKTGKLCPTGWHVPTDGEWTTLTTYLGGVSVAGGKLKETGTTHWISPNAGATNETGFSARAGGSRYITGSFNNIFVNGIWWTSTESSATESWGLAMFSESRAVNRGPSLKQDGFSVRCLKD